MRVSFHTRTVVANSTQTHAQPPGNFLYPEAPFEMLVAPPFESTSANILMRGGGKWLYANIRLLTTLGDSIKVLDAFFHLVGLISSPTPVGDYHLYSHPDTIDELRRGP